MRPTLRLVRAKLHLVTGIAAAMALGACDNKENTYVPPPPPKVSVAQPLRQPVILHLELTGNTTAINAVDLVARVQGFLNAINYVDGAAAKKGDVLFEIEPDQYQAQLAQANGAIDQAKAALSDSTAQYGRIATLGKQDFASQAHVDETLAKKNEDQAELEQAEANQQLAALNLGYTKVTAPFDGVVSAHLVDVGALVGYGGPTKLATIVQLDPIYVYFNVDEQSVLRIKQRLAAQHRTIADVGVIPIDVGTQTEDGYPHHGKLDYVAPQVDTSTGTLTVRGVFENKDRSLLPGLFVRVRVPEERVADAVLIADTALGNDQRGRYVLVLGADDLVEQRVVKVGQLEGSLRIVEDGLHPDDWVVVGGIQRAIPGSKVAPQRITMHGAPTEPAAPAAPVASTTEAAPAPAAAAAKP